MPSLDKGLDKSIEKALLSSSPRFNYYFSERGIHRAIQDAPPLTAVGLVPMGEALLHWFLVDFCLREGLPAISHFGTIKSHILAPAVFSTLLEFQELPISFAYLEKVTPARIVALIFGGIAVYLGAEDAENCFEGAFGPAIRAAIEVCIAYSNPLLETSNKCQQLTEERASQAKIMAQVLGRPKRGPVSDSSTPAPTALEPIPAPPASLLQTGKAVFSKVLSTFALFAAKNLSGQTPQGPVASSSICAHEEPKKTVSTLPSHSSHLKPRPPLIFLDSLTPKHGRFSPYRRPVLNAPAPALFPSSLKTNLIMSENSRYWPKLRSLQERMV
ncbi:hypothetical protein FB45DRAFT_918520 [Roridomyces roridus]|uniref:Uncharacterized protein n=1 Tax=Roridomyces roridus TaxID=1738132 RepID=A0AAD7BR24_9AGAR|nr:hypothetical protein FB45DRAFT_918520 [Roridomyces roridus]